ncbi:GNAT family N-acetyltransferase [Aquamicrobium ahrensii]|uniref:Acetyltransferase n=1 Tax=Aquamicrobium ahrensii TaxID=469551 RepID=A0ABV2KMU1_9HYPH
MSTIRTVRPGDRAAIRMVEASAFGRDDEADLVDALVAAGDAVLELVAEQDGQIVGHILFTRLGVRGHAQDASAVALAPLAVLPQFQNGGIGGALIKEAHGLLRGRGESLSVVLGDPAYYGRFGYRHDRASRFDSVFQCKELMALAWGEAPVGGRLVYPPAFGPEASA